MHVTARGFGMRVVGGKTGADGRLFAYIVWTVPGGPAEKGGLQQGDKVLEWGGVSLTDRSFEEVCTIMDRTGDMVELLVEHGMDLRMCDLLDEPIPSNARKNSGEGLGLQLESDIDKSPASPTRRKLPKTPELGLGESPAEILWYSNHEERLWRRLAKPLTLEVFYRLGHSLVSLFDICACFHSDRTFRISKLGGNGRIMSRSQVTSRLLEHNFSHALLVQGKASFNIVKEGKQYLLMCVF
ncbi:hypothetical protein J6590_047872 [Homalodisca vitripennis]|nr:hypothetical protein J6590_047872 [Homalodisca vitripennis]